MPAALRGQWRTEVGSSALSEVTLTLRDTLYRIRRGGFIGTGRVSVHGDQIEFSGNSQCEGAGVYRWAITADGLTFTPLEPRDPCPRIEVLEGATYTLVEG